MAQARSAEGECSWWLWGRRGWGRPGSEAWISLSIGSGRREREQSEEGEVSQLDHLEE